MMKQRDENTVVRMENLSATEYLMIDGDAPRRMLSGIWLRIKRGQAWGVYAPALYEAGLLLEIMANVRPYEGGRCVLAERGMMRKKRVILPHVFYIGSTDMLYDSMNVLEYLMFATAKQKSKPAARQERIFEWLIECGLGDISLTGIRWLDAPEKAIVILVAAACSPSDIVIFNLPQLVFGEKLRRALTGIVSRMRSEGKALILSTGDAELIQDTCTHTAFVANGRIIFQGTSDYLRAHLDVYTVRIEADAASELKLREALNGCRITSKDDEIYIGGRQGQMPKEIFREILEAGIVPTVMEVHEKTVRNALEELSIRHDLS